jgi:D-alanine-D-alanine ligase
VSGRGPTVAVVYNDPVLPAGHPDAASEADVIAVARGVSEALALHGFEPALLPARPPVRLVLEALDAIAPAVVFNLIEGFGGVERHATHMTGLLELTGLPYTGSTVDALSICLSKGRAKALLRGSGLPTAPFFVIGPDDPIRSWDWPGPAIVKPDAGDGSLGIDQGSVVSDRPALEARVASLRESYGGDVLVEAYLPGPEYNVGLVALPDPEPLPIAEVVYAPGAGAWPILTYAAKWDEGSAEDRASPVRCPAAVERALADELGRLAVAAFRATGCRDYARVDLRLDGLGAPMILEVNPNPDIGRSAGWARAVQASGRDYAATVAAIARQALVRVGKWGVDSGE